MHSKIPKLNVFKNPNFAPNTLDLNTYLRFPAQISSISEKPNTIYIKESKFEISVKNGTENLEEGDYIVVLGLFVGEELLEGNVTRI